MGVSLELVPHTVKPIMTFSFYISLNPNEITAYLILNYFRKLKTFHNMKALGIRFTSELAFPTLQKTSLKVNFITADSVSHL